MADSKAADTSRQSALAKAQRQADKGLREAHPDEWNDLMTVAAKEQGIDWTPPVSAEEKALAQIEALLAKNPGLADRLPSVAPTEGTQKQPGRQQPDSGEIDLDLS